MKWYSIPSLNDIPVRGTAGEVRAPAFLRVLYFSVLLVGSALAYWNDDIGSNLRFVICLALLAALTTLAKLGNVCPRRKLGAKWAYGLVAVLVVVLVLKALFFSYWWAQLAQAHAELPDKPLMLLFWLAAGWWWGWGSLIDRKKAS